MVLGVFFFSYMDFVLDSINKELLLSFVSPEEIFSYYTNISESDINKSLSEKGFKLSSPFRSDNKPNSGFYRSPNGVLRLHDFGGFFPSMDCFDTAAYFMKLNPKNKHDFIKILKTIYEDLSLFKKSKGVTKKSIAAKVKTEFKIESRPFDFRDLKYWSSLGVSRILLEEEKVIPVKNIKSNGIEIFIDDNKKISTCYAYFLGEEENIKIFKIYFPYRTEYRILSNISKNMYIDFDKPNKESEVILTKSKKDELVLKALGFHSLHVQSEAKFLTKEEASYLRENYKDVYILVDFDAVGVRFAQNARKVHGFKNILFIPYIKDTKVDVDDIFYVSSDTYNNGKTLYTGQYGVQFKDISDGVSFYGVTPFEELKSRRLLKDLNLREFYEVVTA